MAKKTAKKSESKKQSKEAKPEAQQPLQAGIPQGAMPQLSKEAQAKLKEIKSKLDKFSKEVVKKFDKYIMGVALLPPPKPEQGKTANKDQINILVLVDDTDSKKMTKMELKEKLSSIIDSIAQDIDKNMLPQTVILSELWQTCYDGKYDMLRMFSMAAPVYDTGMLSAIKIAEIHKSMILKKFEKYIVSYVLAGSLVQGRATKTSDIDVWVVVDDTDVKKMTRAELKDKLRAIIIGMGIEAGEMTGIKNKLNIQVYILTDFWDSLKEANPIIFTLLRDGVPFYDRGVFMPWKLLLKMGKIKPSAEAIDMFMSSGENMLKRVHFKLKDIGMEDIFYAILTPSQAALMLYGVPPPTPRETPELIREIFVEKEKLLEDKYVTTLEKVIAIRKDLEHGTKADVTGKEIDDVLKAAEEYLERIKKLFEQIEASKQEESMVHIYETITTVLRDTLVLEGVEKVSDADLVKVFDEELIAKGKIPAKFLRILKDVVQAKKDYDAKKLTKAEVEKVKKDSGILIRTIIEHMQRKRGRELQKTKLRVKYGEKNGEVTILGDTAYIVRDLEQEEKEVIKAKIGPDGKLGPTEKSSLEDMEKDLANIRIPERVFIKEKIFESLKDLFGKDVEIQVNL
ncbi:nucleotidyltransferase domain-containing protein [Candidatus Woesearchaeota archaeon]|nr:nucleotidyltransferase domain-containing protein [Candidatus Woesearchaeota archaeon]